ncbi:hypothetical protein JXB01_00865 [Candidatus Micrarchaeota archaeon]|nr:hypothetical protein [Candidatus Micrarchaeota archaeon]
MSELDQFVGMIFQSFNELYISLTGVFGTDNILIIAYSLLITLYSLFIWKFYQNLSQRDMFEFEGRGITGFLSYVVKYAVAFPIYTFVWYFGISLFLFLLSEQPVSQILSISIALLAAVRITAYYKEELSVDLAKTLPIALLVIMVTDMSSISFDSFMLKLDELYDFIPQTIQYVSVLILIEVALRTLLFVKGIILPEKKQEIEAEVKKKKK